MMFTYSEDWKSHVSRRVHFRIIIEIAVMAVFVAATITTSSTLALVGAVIIGVLLAADLYYLPKRKELQDSHSVEISDSGLWIRNESDEPVCLYWQNLSISSKLEKNGELVSLTVIESSGIGKVVLEGLENMEILEGKIRERMPSAL